MLRFLKIALILIVVLLINNSCDRFKDSRIQGHWKLIGATDVLTRNRNIYFRFEDGRVAISNVGVNQIEDTCSYGRYFIKNGELDIAAPETYCYGTTYHGKWKIVTFRKDYLVITQDNDLNMRTYEFIQLEEDNK